MIYLIANYLPDQQESMLRFSTALDTELRKLGEAVELVRPEPFFSRLCHRRSRLWKWMGYLDKFVLFPIRLFFRKQSPKVAHICDHSNAPYLRWFRQGGRVITCHDLLAVRGALGEETNCPATSSGRYLQRWILRSLGKADAIASVSEVTGQDVERLVPTKNSRSPRRTVISIGLNYAYRPLPPDEAWAKLARYGRLCPEKPFILHVGSSQARKNRDGVVEITRIVNDHWPCQLILAGEALPLALCRGARRANLDVVEIIAPESDLLQALYSVAHVLLFPSRFEGFGWPIIEAQACNCPVVCSKQPPMGDIAGPGALTFAPDDQEGFARAVIALCEPALRQQYVNLGKKNTERFSTREMAARYLELYRQLEAAA